MPDYSGHMTHSEYVNGQLEQILNIAQGVVDGRVRPLEGAIRLADITHAMNDLKDDPDFLLLWHMVLGDCDHFVFGEARKLFAPSLIAKLDLEMNAMEQGCREDIIVICRKIITRFNKQLKDKNDKIS